MSEIQVYPAKTRMIRRAINLTRPYLLLLLIIFVGSASSTITIRPSSGKATLVPGQNLNFQCGTNIGQGEPQFWWFKRKLDEDMEHIIDPNDEEHIEIHNDRLTLKNPSVDEAGDYYCKQFYMKDGINQVNHSETAMIKVRTQPIIEDFGLDVSHTGKSTTVSDGSRLEIICNVYDRITPVNITWLRSQTSDDDKVMVPLLEGEMEITTTTDASARRWITDDDDFAIHYPTHFVGTNQHGIEIQTLKSYSKKLIIHSVSQEHRGYYICVADNGITERSRKIIFIRVKDRLIALWPFLGILAEFFILFTIIKIWETQRFNYTYGASNASSGPGTRALLASSSSKGAKSSR